jgi:hypothetical protein
VSDSPVVSVVIPSIGTSGTVHGAHRCFVVEAVRGVLATAGVPVEVIVVAGRGMPSSVVDELVALPSAVGGRQALGADGTSGPPAAGEDGVDVAGRVRIVAYDQPFNFSAAVNLGAAHARGEHVLLLNDDVEVISPDWLTRLLDAVGEPGVGAAGAKLLFEDGTLQHAGHTYRTSLDHVGFGLPADAPGRLDILTRRRRVAGVTAACMLMSFRVWDLVGGLCVELPGNYNDVDLCMKIRTAGWSIVYEPRAVLYHYESRSRVAGVRPEEVEFIQARWLSHLVDDPFTPALV